MAVYEILPKTGQLNKSDIMQTLNDNGGFTDDDFSSFFKKTANINIYSFRKPYRHNALFRLTDEEIRSINCGLKPLQITSYTTLPSEMDGGMNGWEYELPISGTPHRINDFRGYYTNARPMIESFFVPETASSQFENASVKATAIVNQQDGLSVSLADLGELKNGYPSVYVKQVGGSQYRVYTGSNPLSDGTFDVDIEVDDLSEGNWEVYPFITLGSRYYTIPNVQYRTLKITGSYFTIALFATKRTDGTKAIDYTITVNNSGSAITWTNNSWRLRFMGNDFSTSMQQYEMSGSLQNTINIKGNGETVITGSITNINTTMWNQVVMILWVSFDSGSHIQSFSIVENDKG